MLMHSGPICIAFCLSVCLSVIRPKLLDNNSYLRNMDKGPMGQGQNKGSKQKQVGSHQRQIAFFTSENFSGFDHFLCSLFKSEK